jgi:2-keto-4-pentenoate hydratase/2-oxohepta-3-ene-1,7-dioic acid hydratase in catechol pathway
MRLVTYDADGNWRAGVLIQNRIVDSLAAARAAGIVTEGDPVTNRAIIQWPREQQMQLEESARALSAAGSANVFSPEDTTLGPPIPDPDKIICLGLNYRSHVQETGLATYQVPILFAKFPNSLAGPTRPILLPRLSEEIDYEGELAVVIGKRGKEIGRAQALEHVAGYMALNDVSARDLQFQTGQWLSGKALDTFAPCGPALVIHEIQDPQSLQLSTRLNGQTLQHGNTRDMIFPIVEIISYISQLLTLEPGDIIATGTPEGVGFKRNPPIFLRHGDIVEVEVEGIGTLRNPVMRPQVQD